MMVLLFRSLMISSAILACMACGSVDDTSANVDSVADEATQEIPALDGDLSCFSPGVSWLEQQLDVALATSESAAIQVKPLGKDDGVGEVDVSIWFSNLVAGDPDVVGTTDMTGQLELNVPMCTPLTYRAVRTLDTEITYKANMVFDPANPVADFTVVENVTAASIQAMLTESADQASSIVAGTAYDCAGEPLANARVRLRDGSGNLLAEARDYYFNASGYPTKRRHQDYSNTDGKWVLFNVPAGDVSIEVYGQVCPVEGEECVEIIVGTSRLNSIGESINIGNVYAGVEGGVNYPASCLQ